MQIIHLNNKISGWYHLTLSLNRLHCSSSSSNNNNNKNNNNNNNNFPPRPGNPAGDSLISWGEGSSLTLVGNPSRDGVSIKILVRRHLKPNPQLL